MTLRPSSSPNMGTAAAEVQRLECNQSPLLPARDRHVVALRGTGIELARAPDLLLRVLDHFLPLRNPANGAGNREQHGEHRGGETHSFERDARIEIDVGIELFLYEIVVVQCDPLELECDVEQRIVLDSDFAQHFVAGLLHDLGAWVVMLVDPVAEAHKAEAVVLVLGAADVFRDAFGLTDLAQHVQRGLVGAAMQAKGLAPEEPASLTVEVEAFCSWSACKMKMRSIARARTALGL